MDISFKTAKLAKTFNEEKALRQTYGDRMAKVIMTRLAVLKNAPTLSRVPATRPERRHLLTGRRKGQYAVDLVHPMRLVFEPDHDPVPRADDGGIDTDEVTAIVVVGVVDYH